jgi:beta-mannosidase
VVNPSTRRSLSTWTLHHVGGGSPVPVDGVPATVPGCVHTDLLTAGLIPDPFVDANELAVAWVADADWEYRTTVDFDAVAEHERAELVFHGFDTLAAAILDGEVVAESENMHRTYRVDVRGRRGGMVLAVRFRSATREAEARRDRAGEWPSSSFGRPFNYIRKMAIPAQIDHWHKSRPARGGPADAHARRGPLGGGTPRTPRRT